jgi:DNA-directed RNA polymerase subunit RPC12/RpoP
MSEPVNTSKIFKEQIQCFSCNQSFYFTLWEIAESQRVVCPYCSANINLADDAYRQLVVNVKEVISAISDNPN